MDLSCYGDVKVVGNSPDFTNVLVVVSRVHKMTRLVARIKILPSDAEQNLDNVIQEISKNLPEGMQLKGFVKEPLAFGLFCIIGDFILEDSEGQMDQLEDSIKSHSGVGEIEVINVSRESVKMK